MWFDRHCDDAVFGDVRREEHVLCDGRVLRIEPDVMLDFRALPFPDASFRLVVFDPPHLKHAGRGSWMRAKYGVLGQDWKQDIHQGFVECFRVLASDGVLVFKWSEQDVKVNDVLRLSPVRPLFGHPLSPHGRTHWAVFLKP
ncbi:MAG: class I SAM-dependent methyltransferase [Azoarcus sp.]|jgi:hypothetical protein|nr:class I SAM-dependent methyltransferase [Azoarcus sp.]